MLARSSPQTSSQKSLGSSILHGGSNVSVVSSATIFEQIVPQDPEEMKIELPRGMRFALSRELAGKSSNQAASRTIKTYHVTVEPNGRAISARERFKPRMDLPKNADDLNGDFQEELARVPFNNAALDAIMEERFGRSAFREERRAVFELNRHVPCLVNPRLVPSWRSTTGDNGSASSPAQEAQNKIDEAIRQWRLNDASYVQKRRNRKNLQRFVVPTISVAMKRTPKVEGRQEHWAATGESEARKALVEPFLEQEYSDTSGPPMMEALRMQERAAEVESREKWIKAPTEAPLPLVPKEEDITAAQIAQIREQGKSNLQSLRHQYEAKRESYVEAQKKTKADGSSFEQFLRNSRKKVHQEEANNKKREQEQASIEQQKYNYGVRGSLGNFLSLGVAKLRRETATVETAPTTTSRKSKVHIVNLLSGAHEDRGSRKSRIMRQSVVGPRQSGTMQS